MRAGELRVGRPIHKIIPLYPKNKGCIKTNHTPVTTVVVKLDEFCTILSRH